MNWKCALTNIVFDWMVKSVTEHLSKDQMDGVSADVYHSCMLTAATTAAKVFAPDGWLGLPLMFAANVDGPAVVPQRFDKASGRMVDAATGKYLVRPIEIVTRLVEEISALGHTDQEKAVYKVCLLQLELLVADYLCTDHRFVFDVDGSLVCETCGAVKEAAYA